MTAQYEDILFEVAEGVATITLNRPRQLNSFRGETILELTAAFEAAAADPSIGVVVVTGAGTKAFCVGGDLKWETSMDSDTIRAGTRQLLSLSNVMRTCGKPIIAAVRGYCVGGGNQLNMICDITIASENAMFGDGAAKVGGVSFWWGTALLPRLVGDKRAREIMYLCRHYTAPEALAMGWINRVVPDDQLEAETQRWCQEILQKSPQAIQLIKSALNHSSDKDYDAVVQTGYTASLLYDTDQLHEAMNAFLEKREPDYGPWRQPKQSS